MLWVCVYVCVYVCMYSIHSCVLAINVINVGVKMDALIAFSHEFVAFIAKCVANFLGSPSICN